MSQTGTPNEQSERHGSRPDRRLSRRQRITSPRVFRETYAQGECYRARHMVMWIRTAADGRLRLGVVAGRKVGKAHERTRARRLLREAYRLNRHRFRGNKDVILVGRQPLILARRSEVESELMRLARRAGILAGPESR